MSDQPTPPPGYVDYPRNQFQPSNEFDRPPGVYFDAVSDAWKLVSRDLGTWMVIALVAGLLGAAMTAPFQMLSMVVQGKSDWLDQTPVEPGRLVLSMLVNLLGSSVAYPLYASLYFVALKQIRGEAINIGDVFKGFSYFVPLMIFAILYNLILIVATLLCCVPAVFVLGPLSIATLLIIDRGASATDAIKQSFKVLGTQAWLLGLMAILIGTLAGVIGTLLCCVGLLITFPVYIVTLSLHYNYFFPRETPTYTPGEAPLVG